MSNSSKYSIRQKIGLFLGLFLFVLVLFVQPPSGMNPFAQRMGAVVLLMASATLSNSYAFMMPVGNTTQCYCLWLWMGEGSSDG